MTFAEAGVVGGVDVEDDDEDDDEELDDPDAVVLLELLLVLVGSSCEVLDDSLVLLVTGGGSTVRPVGDDVGDVVGEAVRDVVDGLRDVLDDDEDFDVDEGSVREGVGTFDTSLGVVPGPLGMLVLALLPSNTPPSHITNSTMTTTTATAANTSTWPPDELRRSRGRPAGVIEMPPGAVGVRNGSPGLP